MTATQTLLADPVNFLRKNMLGLGPVLDDPPLAMVKPSGTVTVKLYDLGELLRDGGVPAVRSRNRKGLARLMPSTNKAHWEKAVDYYSVVPAAPGDTETFEAYICPYATDATKTKFLGTAANFMFTGDMNGCTFGVGMPNANGGVLVGHANAAGSALDDNALSWDQRLAPQQAAQKQGLAANNVSQMMVDPAVYRAGELEGSLKAITIGIRVNGEWSFWYQHQNHDGMNGIKMMALVPLK
ncbi:MAG: hypothetical protein JWL84_742 [Rhodospirillales bacterium]|jgi:hypothetical protein|nr:hypothetical protein [Rhodospirillales bacterium]